MPRIRLRGFALGLRAKRSASTGWPKARPGTEGPQTKRSATRGSQTPAAMQNNAPDSVEALVLTGPPWILEPLVIRVVSKS